MSDRYWYQDGWNVLGIAAAVCVAAYLFHAHQEQVKFDASRINPKIDLKFHQPLFFGSPSLECSVWHEEPDALRNILVTASVSTDPNKSEKSWDLKHRNHVVWQPGRDNEVPFSFPMKEFPPEHPLYLRIRVGGKHNKFDFIALKWADGKWHGDWKDGE